MKSLSFWKDKINKLLAKEKVQMKSELKSETSQLIRQKIPEATGDYCEQL